MEEGWIRTKDGDILAREVKVADGFLARIRGLMFKPAIPNDYALVFDFQRERMVGLHMLFVPFDICAVFLDSENRVTKVVELPAWRGWCRGYAKRVIELPVGKSDLIEVGDELVFE